MTNTTATPTGTTAVRNAEAEKAYQQAVTRATFASDDIASFLNLATHPTARRGVDWGHVGDAARLAAELTEIADRLCKRGEYADTPTVASFHAGS